MLGCAEAMPLPWDAGLACLRSAGFARRRTCRNLREVLTHEGPLRFPLQPRCHDAYDITKWLWASSPRSMRRCLVDERLHALNRRSSSAWARIRRCLAQDLVGLAQLTVFALQRLDPFAFRDSHTRRQAAITLGLSTQRRNASRAQPIFAPIEPIGSDSEPCSHWCSSTICTAYSRS